MKNFTAYGLLMLLLISTGACQLSNETPEKEISVLRIGILPDQKEDLILKQYQPLFDHLSRETGFSTQFVPAKSYTDLLANIHAGEIDLFYLGGITFIHSYKKDKIIPLVMRDIDTRFTSYFLVSSDNPAEALKDLKNQTFTFGSKFSTSGHYMPRFYLEKSGIIPELYFKEVRYSGKHDTTALWVQNAEVEAGAANSSIVNRLIQSGKLDKQKIRILWETPPYPNYVWAVHPGLDASTQIKIADAFLNLSLDNPEHRDILNSLGTESFLPSDLREFSKLLQVYNRTHKSAQVN